MRKAFFFSTRSLPLLIRACIRDHQSAWLVLHVAQPEMGPHLKGIARTDHLPAATSVWSIAILDIQRLVDESDLGRPGAEANAHATLRPAVGLPPCSSMSALYRYPFKLSLRKEHTARCNTLIREFGQVRIRIRETPSLRVLV